jgi:hypothetical protein
MRDGKGDITTNSKEIQRIFREYLENLYSSHRLENPEEMDKFLEAYGLLKLSQENLNHLN